MRSSIASGLRGRWAAIGLALCGFCLHPAAFAQGSGPGVREPAAAAPAGAAQAAAAPAAASPTTSAGGADAVPLQSDPRRTTTIVQQVARLQKEGKPDEALRTLEAGLKQSPRDPQLRFLYGVAMSERGRRADAIAVFEQLTTDYPELPEPYNNLAVMHAAAGDLDRARAALENAVRALPGYALAHENLGDLYLRMSTRAYERALDADAKNASAKTKLGLARELLARVAPPPAAAQPAATPPAATTPAGATPASGAASPAGRR